MKKILFILLFAIILLGCAFGQETLHYGNGTIAWSDNLIDTDGIPYPELPTYEIVAYDKNIGITGMFSLGTSINMELDYVLDGYERRVYICGVRAVYNEKVSDYIWSNIADDTLDGIPFGIVPGEKEAFTLIKPKGMGIK